MEATEGDSREYEDRPSYYSDDHLWPILAVCNFIKESGDIEFLNTKIPYYEKDKEGNPLESDTALNHLRKAIEFTHNDCGDHGLPLLGFACHGLGYGVHFP